MMSERRDTGCCAQRRFCGRVFLALLVATSVAKPAGAAPETVLLNASYDVAREFYKDYNPIFQAYWLQKTGQAVRINQSHDGSTKQARAVIDGLAADVVTMNQGLDMDVLADHGMVAPDWSTRFADGAAPTYSTMLLVVRRGNPKAIRDWDDLAKPGVKVVIVNPKTSGNGRYSYLALWGYAKKGGASDAQAAQFVGSVLKNVPVLESGGRAATTTFLQRDIGDVLVTFESEVIQIDREFGAGKVDVVYPSVSIRADNPVAVVLPVVKKRQDGELAEQYLRYLYSEPAQELAARHFLRVRSGAVMARYAATFRPLALFSVEEVFGSWKAAQKTHFDDGGQFDRLMASLGKG